MSETYHVLPWSGADNGWYKAADVVKSYKNAKAAQKFADKSNRERGTNFVVRSSKFVR